MATDSPDLRRALLLRHAAAGRQGAGDQGGALLHYAETDDNINKGIAAYEAALKANNKKFTILLSRLSTPSTTTPAPRATTSRRPILPGSGPSGFQGTTSAHRRAPPDCHRVFSDNNAHRAWSEGEQNGRSNGHGGEISSHEDNPQRL
jgi:hypothetical protein